jgi:hypothetical protein
MRDATITENFGIIQISADEAAQVSGGMMKLPTVPTAPKVGGMDNGWTWGTVTDLPANQGVGVVIHF